MADQSNTKIEVKPPFGERMPGLDGIRGVAILSVVGFHALKIGLPSGELEGFARFVMGSAWAGVDLFFVLSGFLITGILCDSRTSEGYFRNFYARRTLRIFPLYYAVLAGALLLVPAIVSMPRLPGEYPKLLDNQMWLWTYTQNFLQARGAHMTPGFGHFWSLAVEEQFYLLWPLVVFMLPRRPLLYLCIAVCVAEPLLRFELLQSGHTAWAVRQYTFTRLDSLLYGAIASILMREKLSWSWLRPARRVIIGLAILVVAALAWQEGYLGYESVNTLLYGYSALGILFSWLIYTCATTSGSSISSVLSNPVLRWFGRYSYGLYVFHWPVTQAVGPKLTPVIASHPPAVSLLAAFITVLVISSIAALLSWHLFEKHFIKLKKYFEYSSRKPEPAPERKPQAPAVLGFGPHKYP